jgi:hypothetical protein
MDELIDQLGYHSDMVLNCDVHVQFTYHVQCGKLDWTDNGIRMKETKNDTNILL